MLHGNLPVSMSRKFIYKYIRKKFHFNGLIITDDIKMNAIKLWYGKKYSFKKAFEAGNDIILMKYTNDEKQIENLIKTVKNNKKKEARINRAVNRIIKIKEKYKINNDKITVDNDFCNIINKKIRDVKEKIDN